MIRNTLRRAASLRPRLDSLLPGARRRSREAARGIRSDVPLPFDMTPAGAPACFLRVSADVLLVAPTNATGTGAVNVAIPNDVSLLNSSFFNQFLVYDPPVNALDFVVSTSGKGTIGQF